MGFHGARKAGISAAQATALDLAEGLDALTSTATTDLVAGDGLGGWQRTALSSIATPAGALAGATFISAAGETAVAGELTIVSCDDEDDNITVDLPASPSAGDTVRLVNVSTEDYDVIAGRNGETINFAESDFAVGGPGMAAVYTYTGATWIVGRFGSPPVMSQAEAEAGTSTEPRLTTPERQAQAIAALGGGGGGGGSGGGGGGPGEYLLGVVATAPFASTTGQTVTNGHKAACTYDAALWRSFSSIEIRVSGWKIGSATVFFYVKVNGSTVWTTGSMSLTTSGSGATSSVSTAGTTFPSVSNEMCELHWNQSGTIYMSSVEIWGIV